MKNKKKIRQIDENFFYRFVEIKIIGQLNL